MHFGARKCTPMDANACKCTPMNANANARHICDYTNSKGGVDTKPTSILKNISHKTTNCPNFNRSNGKATMPFVNICQIQCKVKPANLDKGSKEKFGRAKKFLMDGFKGGKPRSRKQIIDKLSRLE